MVLSCDRDGGRRPKTKKTAKQSCTIYTRHASGVISAPRHKSPSGIYLFGKGSMLRSRPHDYVAVYRVPKFVLVQKLWTLQNGLKIFQEVSKFQSFQFFTFFHRRFDQLLVIQLTSNFVHTFYRAFPRGLFFIFSNFDFFSEFWNLETLKVYMTHL